MAALRWFISHNTAAACVPVAANRWPTTPQAAHPQGQHCAPKAGACCLVSHTGTGTYTHICTHTHNFTPRFDAFKLACDDTPGCVGERTHACMHACACSHKPSHARLHARLRSRPYMHHSCARSPAHAPLRTRPCMHALHGAACACFNPIDPPTCTRAHAPPSPTSQHSPPPRSPTAALT